MKKKYIELSRQDYLEKLKNAPTWPEVDDSEIDCSDIPELTEEELKQMKPCTEVFEKIFIQANGLWS